jgi:hypothetical protein
MKQIKIIKTPLNTDPTTSKFYGVKALDGQTGFVKQASYCNGKFEAVCSNGLTRHNSWSLLADKTLAKTVEKLLAQKFEVYEFDTPQEMYSWLANN